MCPLRSALLQLLAPQAPLLVPSPRVLRALLLLLSAGWPRGASLPDRSRWRLCWHRARRCPSAPLQPHPPLGPLLPLPSLPPPPPALPPPSPPISTRSLGPPRRHCHTNLLPSSPSLRLLLPPQWLPQWLSPCDARPSHRLHRHHLRLHRRSHHHRPHRRHYHPGRHLRCRHALRSCHQAMGCCRLRRCRPVRCFG